MKKTQQQILIGGLLLVLGTVAVWHFYLQKSTGQQTVQNAVQQTVQKPGRITVDYPKDGSVFPPEFPSPTWVWRDAVDRATSWEIRVQFADGTAPIELLSKGEPMDVGKIDPRAKSSTNRPPALTEEQAAAHTWRPDADVWKAIRAHSVNAPATVVISGYGPDDSKTVVSRGEVSIQTSEDPVGAPIFYRDVPLMPSENEKGVIKPLAPEAVPLIAWRLRNVARTESQIVMDGIHTCANCHSFSLDGKKMGLDMDGPRNDKGLYAIADVQPEMTIESKNMVEWSTFRGKLGSRIRVGFMSRISPDGSRVVTTVNDPGLDQTDYERRKNPVDLIQNYYVANFTDYRFLQVFYPTRGVLAWYSPEYGKLQYLPGADDPEYVHANAVWSPDGKYLVFIRAKAKDANPPDAPTPEYAGDPNELPMKYDLYRIPFNDGQGGEATPIKGASENGMSNTFPKISPDGRWIVFVQSKNGLLIRPDSQLYIIPAEGGTARKMTCNMSRMNSWHSFSPNGKWMVFSSKSRSPYTQMYLTHIDEAGNDSPAILIENATAANRAVNLPEFVNIAADSSMKIDAKVAEYARYMDEAIALMKKGEYAEAIPKWKKALQLTSSQWQAHNSLGVALMETGQVDDAISHYEAALALNPEYPEAMNNLGEALAASGRVDEGIAQFEKAVTIDPAYVVAHGNLGMLYARSGQNDKAIVHMRKVVEITPEVPDAHRNLGHALASNGQFDEARQQLLEAIKRSGGRDALAMHLLGRVLADMGKWTEAIQMDQQALQLAAAQKNGPLMQAVNAHLISLQGKQ